jgi:ubiquinol-cytochrome c reductase cytochrome b subunit
MANPWARGVTILLILIITAFLGYVLPWGQISFWGATVITNFVTTIPIFGPKIVIWIWGGFNVNNATLGFFFTLHFLLPFSLAIIVLFHLIFLHETRSSRNIIIHESFSKIKFCPYYFSKDALNIIIVLFFIFFSLIFPWNLGDPENWIKANPIISPVHIQPEWYFLFAYAILRAIPNKLGGVIALAFRVIFLYFLPIFFSYKSPRKLILLIALILLSISFLILTWLGACVVEEPYIFIGQVFTLIYFVRLFIFCF